MGAGESFSEEMRFKVRPEKMSLIQVTDHLEENRGVHELVAGLPRAV